MRTVVTVLLFFAVLTARAGSQPPAAPTLDTLDRDIRVGLYGHVNHVLVMRDSRVVVSHRYARDYSAISRGR
jgi:hypothetical protein